MHRHAKVTHDNVPGGQFLVAREAPTVVTAGVSPSSTQEEPSAEDRESIVALLNACVIHHLEITNCS